MSKSKSIEVKIPAKDKTAYKVLIGNKILENNETFKDLKTYSKIGIFFDSAVKSNHLESLKKVFPNAVTLENSSSEKTKSSDTLIKLWNFLSENSFDRKSLLINLGGGIIGDVGGFGASTYMRGIDFIQIPTTLLSQADASVGGKTGINLNGVKNICGSFSQPVLVVVDTETLKTLPFSEIRSGFAEIIKHGLIADENHFSAVKNDIPGIEDSNSWISLLKDTISIKAKVVEEDEKEGGLRKILNFGHTAGHAFESLSHKLENQKPLLHGEAVALGILFESRLSLLRGILTNSDLEAIETCLKNLGYLEHLSLEFNYDEFLSLLKKDKKNVAGEIKWTLLARIGSAIFDQVLNEEKISETFYNMFNN